jgi:hypothetical protein
MIDPEDLAEAVHAMFTQEARDEMGPLRIRKQRKKTKLKSTIKVSLPPAAAIKPSSPS